MSSLETYLSIYEKRIYEIRKVSEDLKEEVIAEWDKISNTLTLEMKELFIILGTDIEKIFENPNLKKQFLEKLKILDSVLLKRLEKLKKESEKEYEEVSGRFEKSRKTYESFLAATKKSAEELEKRKKEKVSAVSQKRDELIELENYIIGMIELLKEEKVLFSRFDAVSSLEQIIAGYDSIKSHLLKYSKRRK